MRECATRIAPCLPAIFSAAPPHVLLQYSSSYSLVEIIYRSAISSDDIRLCGRFNYTRGIRAKVAVFIVWWQPFGYPNMVQKR